MTGRDVSDCTLLETSLDIGPDITPRAVLTNKGYDPAANHAACRKRDSAQMIPYRSNAKLSPYTFGKAFDKTIARIEQAMDKLKRLKRVALRCGPSLHLLYSVISVKSVPTARTPA